MIKITHTALFIFSQIICMEGLKAWCKNGTPSRHTAPPVPQVHPVPMVTPVHPISLEPPVDPVPPITCSTLVALVLLVPSVPAHVCCYKPFIMRNRLFKIYLNIHDLFGKMRKKLRSA